MQPYRLLHDTINDYADRRQRSLNLDQLVEFGSAPDSDRALKAGLFLYDEIPIRLAHMIREIEIMPFGLAETASVRRIHALYVRSFAEIYDFQRPETEEQLNNFILLISDIKHRHSHVIEMMAQGIQELKAKSKGRVIGDRITLFLDRFYTSRIGIRMLIGQLVALGRQSDGWVGIISSQTSPYQSAKQALRQVEILCRAKYGFAPKIQFEGQLDLKFTYIPSHLDYMLTELLKNSFRATAEFNKDVPEEELPPIHFIIAGGTEDITIKISDHGGGIPRSKLERCWTYLYSSAEPPPEVSGYHSEIPSAPLAGMGFGLPITRLYARYFGGDLTIMSMEGYGTDAYLHLNKLGYHAEKLP